MGLSEDVIAIAVQNGATLAGITGSEALRSSSSHTLYKLLGTHDGLDFNADGDALPDVRSSRGPGPGKSLLVIGLHHPEDRPELDWWDGRGTPGNRVLIDVIERTRRDILNRFGLGAGTLHYYIEKGGVFLKDAAVLAGLGCIGRNNMLVTPSWGPRVRLRALVLDAEIDPTGPVDFDPCEGCEVHCRAVCPENAMGGGTSIFERDHGFSHLPGRDGAYDREACNVRMKKDVLNGGGNASIRYCRKCEFACPVGK